MNSLARTGRGRLVGLTGWRHSNGWIFGTMLLSAMFSLWAAFELSKDAVILAATPDADLSCNINSVISCGAVGVSWQAELFGFPNSFLGLICEPVVITIAVAGLSGVKFKRWFMFTAQVVYLAGLIFAYWLFYQSVTSIGALCPFCLIITVGTTFVFFTLLHYNIRENFLYLPKKAQKAAQKFVKYDGDFLTAIVLVGIVAVIILSNYGTQIFG